ncbi:MAG: hypothetical protein ACK559_21915, partial [bacterium]
MDRLQHSIWAIRLQTRHGLGLDALVPALLGRARHSEGQPILVPCFVGQLRLLGLNVFPSLDRHTLLREILCSRRCS